MWWIPLSAAWGCDLDSLDARIDAAEAAFVARDVERLATAVRAVDDELVCQRVVVPPVWCARVHFVHALAEFNVDEARCLASLRAAHHAEPTFRLPEDVVPVGHAIHHLAWRAEEVAPTWSLSRKPIRIDGLPSAAIPVGLPFVEQPIGSGDIRGARLVDPGGRSGGGGTGGAVRWVAGGVGVVGLGLLGAAHLQRVEYANAVADGEIARANEIYLPRTNGLSIAWAATGFTAGALFGVSFAL